MNAMLMLQLAVPRVAYMQHARHNCWASLLNNTWTATCKPNVDAP